MAKIKNHEFCAKAADGKQYAAKVEVLVDSEGIFSIGVPEDLVETARRVVNCPISSAPEHAYFKWSGKVSVGVLLREHHGDLQDGQVAG